MNYVDELAHELMLVGVRGRLRARILHEIADHLDCDPDASEQELGAPADLAREFADELGTARVKRAGFESLAALVVAGTLFAIAFLTAGWGGFAWSKVAATPSPFLSDLGGVLMLVSPQLAFVAGLLAGIRALRHRCAGVVPRSEAVIIGRRSMVALVCGLATLIGLALVAIEFQHVAAGWWTTLTLACAVVGSCALATAAPAVLATIVVKPTAPGHAGDVFDDLGVLMPPALRGRPWAFAIAVATLIALVVTLAGVLQADPFDGAARGLVDGLGCLAGFGLLGRYLGLRGPSAG
jgi:hypothetical protein